MNPKAEWLIKKSGSVQLWNKFLDAEASASWFKLIHGEVAWREKQIRMFGKWIQQPRQMSWQGDPGCAYKYSGQLFEAEPWTPSVLGLKNLVEQSTGWRFNSALVNLYRNENDSMGSHRDNEPELGPHPKIASLSLGAARPFVFRNIDTDEKLKLNLQPGSLLLMSGETQEHWKHELPKLRQEVEARINITFRNIIRPA